MTSKWFLITVSTALICFATNTRAEFSGDPSFGGIMTYCKYYHIHPSEYEDWEDLRIKYQHYKAKMIKGSTVCPKINPQVGSGEHEVLYAMSTADPRYKNLKRDTTVPSVDDHDCAIVVEYGNVN